MKSRHQKRHPEKPERQAKVGADKRFQIEPGKAPKKEQ
jgi:hypothetical protein